MKYSSERPKFSGNYDSTISKQLNFVLPSHNLYRLVASYPWVDQNPVTTIIPGHWYQLWYELTYMGPNMT